MPLFTKLPSWASILITVIAAIIVVGLVSWGTYNLVKPGPKELPGGEGGGKCENLWWYDNEHKSCQEPKQFCGVYMYEGLKTFETKEECEKSLAAEEEFKDWKTYWNEEYGFEVRYPEIRGSVEVMDREYFEICITGSELPGGLCFLISVRDINLDNFIKEWNSLDPPFTKIYQQEDYTLNGENATKLKSTTTLGIDTTFIFIEKNNKGYILKYGDYDPIHNQILSTFKFIP